MRPPMTGSVVVAAVAMMCGPAEATNMSSATSITASLLSVTRVYRWLGTTSCSAGSASAADASLAVYPAAQCAVAEGDTGGGTGGNAIVVGRSGALGYSLVEYNSTNCSGTPVLNHTGRLGSMCDAVAGGGSLEVYGGVTKVALVTPPNVSQCGSAGCTEVPLATMPVPTGSAAMLYVYGWARVAADWCCVGLECQAGPGPASLLIVPHDRCVPVGLTSSIVVTTTATGRFVFSSYTASVDCSGPASGSSNGTLGGSGAGGSCVHGSGLAGGALGALRVYPFVAPGVMVPNPVLQCGVEGCTPVGPAVAPQAAGHAALVYIYSWSTGGGCASPYPTTLHILPVGVCIPLPSTVSNAPFSLLVTSAVASASGGFVVHGFDGVGNCAGSPSRTLNGTVGVTCMPALATAKPSKVFAGPASGVAVPTTVLQCSSAGCVNASNEGATNDDVVYVYMFDQKGGCYAGAPTLFILDAGVCVPTVDFVANRVVGIKVIVTEKGQYTYQSYLGMTACAGNVTHKLQGTMGDHCVLDASYASSKPLLILGGLNGSVEEPASAYRCTVAGCTAASAPSVAPTAAPGHSESGGDQMNMATLYIICGSVGGATVVFIIFFTAWRVMRMQRKRSMFAFELLSTEDNPPVPMSPRGENIQLEWSELDAVVPLTDGQEEIEEIFEETEGPNLSEMQLSFSKGVYE
eukprot:CAMPEP_0206286004 /NCGR_PEP_ID=MMETSP0106_2-20121207/382_1 /ASSEMBLY_ACC=CAM_ASM_000206 /TAXON_ID=81532 /ORGANISM="Acanthoeca-like sp., Strain 10tr" /LENGTH=689 /DNA_ID=CAMNT_0053716523 /DNA_START=46 /DNA_END=2115 /DNA_ORIENTATION=-